LKVVRGGDSANEGKRPTGASGGCSFMATHSTPPGRVPATGREQVVGRFPYQLPIKLPEPAARDLG
jgi:hypothetical protein